MDGWMDTRRYARRGRDRDVTVAALVFLQPICSLESLCRTACEKISTSSFPLFQNSTIPAAAPLPASSDNNCSAAYIRHCLGIASC